MVEPAREICYVKSFIFFHSHIHSNGSTGPFGFDLILGLFFMKKFLHRGIEQNVHISMAGTVSGFVEISPPNQKLWAIFNY